MRHAHDIRANMHYVRTAHASVPDMGMYSLSERR